MHIEKEETNISLDAAGEEVSIRYIGYQIHQRARNMRARIQPLLRVLTRAHREEVPCADFRAPRIPLPPMVGRVSKFRNVEAI